MSGERSQRSSNPASDFDFADVQQELEEIDKVELMTEEVQKLDMSLMLVLNKFCLDDATLANFGLFQIQYSSLSSLQREDLIKLGIHDNKLQNDMLEEFRSLEGQDKEITEPRVVIENFNQELQELPSTSRNPPRTKPVIDSLQEHLYKINTLLAAVTFQLGSSSSSASGIVVNKRLCTPQVVLNLLGQLSHHTAEMDEIIKLLQDPDGLSYEEFEYKKKKQRERKTNCFIMLGAVGIFVAGFWMARRMGLRKVF